MILVVGLVRFGSVAGLQYVYEYKVGSRPIAGCVELRCSSESLFNFYSVYSSICQGNCDHLKVSCVIRTLTKIVFYALRWISNGVF